nr:MAPEG family protein [Achromobacter sp. DMS1]
MARSRDAAQANTFEALPFFFGAVLFALYTQAPARAWPR